MTESTQFYCSDLALAEEVPLHASATRGDVWFLLEYPYRWGHKAVEESDLSPEIKAHLAAPERSGLEVRTLLIRQGDSLGRDGIQFFIGFTRPEGSALYEYRLEAYEDLLSLDLAAIAARGAADHDRLRTEPLYLVCANGKRDLCCARFGRGLYEAMQEADAANVWMSSHIGGHNLAPITLFFPQGVNYGRTTPEKIGGTMTAFRHGQVDLDNYRGRVCFDKPVQAAEHYWRSQTGILSLSALKIVSVEQTGENDWEIDVSGMDGAAAMHLMVARHESEHLIPITCAQNKHAPIERFRVTPR